MKKILTLLFFVLIATLVHAQTNQYKYLELKNVDTTSFTQRVGQFWYNPTIGQYTFHDSKGYWHFTRTLPQLNYYPDLSSTTLTANALSYGRSSSGIVIVGNWAYIIGGYNTHRGTDHANITNNQVWRAPVSNMATWTQLANGPFQQRSRFGCVSTGPNKIIVYGQDPYDCGGANCNQYRDAWLGTINPSTGVITWTLQNAAMPMSDRFWYASFAHKGCAYLAGGICDDWPAPPTHQCAQKSTELWKSCDDGVTWSRVSQNNLWGRNNFDPADTVYGRQVYGNGVSFNNKIYMLGGGTVASNIFQRYTFDSAIWVSPDDGVTFSMIKPKLHKGVTSPAVTVVDNRLYVLFGQQYNPAGVVGKPSQLIQYLDTTEAVHQVYTSIPIREDAVAATVVINGISKIVVGLGDDPTQTDTTKQFLNDLYLLTPTSDKKIVYGDVAQLRSLTVDDSLMANYVNPNTVSGTLALNKFLYLNRISKNSFTAGFGTTTPETKIDFMAANIVLGTTLGAGGANQFENYVRTLNTTKIGRLKGSTYNNTLSDVISYWGGNGDYEIYLGGTSGIGTAVLPNKIFAAVVGLDPALRILPGGTTFFNPVSIPALNPGYIAKTANYTITANDFIIDCTANSFTVTLPSAVGITAAYVIKNSGTATTITIATNSSQTIDGAAPGTLTTKVPLRVVSNGVNWITW